MKNDLRARKRMPTANLSSSVRVSKGLLKSIWEDARPKDFSLFGMCLKTNRPFNTGDKITVSLTLEMDMGGITIDQITAKIIRVNKLVGFYEYGIEFDKKIVTNPDNPLTLNMMRIENFLTKQEALSAKIAQKAAL
ncbi:PilZ domain-containing protein [Alkalimarinus alittae]|uniref:PilZ domain-containing protein n=1 Tax=Alkalimarinus alittae TaxID=2961619 RepID=A0ABY6N006_9ALTE|nr:PilZ domain-containing protein [Alkalimarinus alittae]UZE95329.1 PilZ domain-containing protein [Alkalimarinus alittae]